MGFGSAGKQKHTGLVGILLCSWGMKRFSFGLILLVIQCTALSGGSLVKKITAVHGSDIWIECTFDAARMSQDDPVWWLHCENSNCTEIQHFIGGVDQLQDRAASRRGRVYPDKLREGNASLFIENVQMSDEGHYECSAILTDGPCTKTYVLTVLASYEPPQLTEALDTRSFTCSSRNGFPPALVTWTGGSGMTYTPDSVTQHTLNPEGLYDVVSNLTRRFTEEETICCTVWHQSLQEHKTNCMRVTPGQETNWHMMFLIFVPFFLLACVGLMKYCYLWKGRQNMTRKRKRISNCTDDTVIVLIGKPQHGVLLLINSCVFAYKAEEHFHNQAGADPTPPDYALPEEVPLNQAGADPTPPDYTLLEVPLNQAGADPTPPDYTLLEVPLNQTGADPTPPDYALPEEVPLTEHITITRALLQQHRFCTVGGEACLDKWRREAQSHRCSFVFVYSCVDNLTAATKDEIHRLFEDVKSVSGSYPFTVLTMKNLGNADVLKLFKDLGSKRVFSFHNDTIHNPKRNAMRDEGFLDLMNVCIDEANSPKSETGPLILLDVSHQTSTAEKCTHF